MMLRTLILAGLVLLSFAGCGKGQKFDLGQTSQNFAQDVVTNKKVDILWVVDDSPTMVSRKSKLTDQIPSLLSALESLRMDYHLAVTNTSMSGSAPTGGTFIGSPKYLSASDSNVRSEITNRILASAAGSSAERSFDSIKKALGATYLAGDGKGFLRSDAILAVVVVSDEDDVSTVSASAMESFLTTLKPQSANGEQNWFMNYIGSLPTSTPICYSNETTLSYNFGTKYIDVSNYSHGTTANVCDNSLALAVSNIKARIVQILTDFPLRTLPVVSTISVSVNGVLVPQSSVNGWTYEASTNVIRFHGTAIPPADAAISVDFKPSSAS